MSDDRDAWARGLVGRRLGDRYVLQKLIGMGGMGAVMQAMHLGMGRTVAVKLLSPELQRHSETLDRFQQEAMAAAKLSRTGVVEVIDFASDPELGPYIVMEFLNGENLATRISRSGRLEPEHAVSIGMELLRTLSVVHASGIVHRDLKPGNVLLARDERGGESVKIVDFGVARVTRGGGATMHTMAGSVLGTPAYMAPEQALSAAEADHRADVYAIGAILYHALSGRQPYQSGSWEQELIALSTGPPPPLASLCPGLPSTLVHVVEQAMERDHERRFQTAAAMLDALSRASRSLSPRASGGGDTIEATRAGVPAAVRAASAAPRASAVPATAAAPAAKKRSRGMILAIVAAAVALPIALCVIVSAVSFIVWRTSPSTRLEDLSDPRAAALSARIDRANERIAAGDREGGKAELRAIGDEALMLREPSTSPVGRMGIAARLALGDAYASEVGLPPPNPASPPAITMEQYMNVSRNYGSAAQEYAQITASGAAPDQKQCALTHLAVAAERVALANEALDGTGYIPPPFLDRGLRQRMATSFRQLASSWYREAAQMEVPGVATCEDEASEGLRRISAPATPQ